MPPMNDPSRLEVLNALLSLRGRTELLSDAATLREALLQQMPGLEQETLSPDSQEAGEAATSELQAEEEAMEFQESLTPQQRNIIRMAFKAIHPDCPALLP